MAYDAKAIEVMIASPSDVPEERQLVRDVIAEWNAINARERKIVLLPVGWETHSSPELSDKPQQLINERLLHGADILVGVFWTRVGSRTDNAISGSVEEIERHRKAGKPVMLYFSQVPVRPDSVDATQYEELRKFKAWAMDKGLIEFYESHADFREKFARQLPMALRENSHLKAIAATAPASMPGVVAPARRGPTLTADALEMLRAAAADEHGMVFIRRHMSGTDISAGSRSFGDGTDRRSVARWTAAVEELRDHRLLRDINGKGEIFEINDAGYRTVEAT